MTEKGKIIVIGSGIAGIAAALRARHQGYDVSVFESADGPGGKIKEKWLDGYRFDLGPSLFTMPWLLEELFVLYGCQIDQHFSYLKLDPVCHYFWNDGTCLHAHADSAEFAKELSAKLGESENLTLSYLQNSGRAFELTAPLFLFRSLHKARTYFSKHCLRAISNLFAIPLRGSLNQHNKRHFKHSKTIQLFNRYATYNGSDPFRAPSTLSVIPHLEFNTGAFFPVGGIYAIVNSLYELAKKQGVKFCFNKKVEEILTENGRVYGIRTESDYYRADKVICNADIHHVYRDLLKIPLKTSKKVLNLEKSTSGLIFYWGIRKKFPELDVHNIFFCDDYQDEFASLKLGNEIYSDPTIYLNISSKVQFSDAPPDCENWFVMINVAHNKSQNWNELKGKARKIVLEKLSRILKTDISSLIEVEDFLDPVLIESRTGSVAGALYGTASNDRFSAFLRHANFSSKVKGLYFCGGSVHPGGGIPLALASAKIVSDCIVNDDSKK